MSFCKDCFKGVTHEGTAEGTWETINGVNCYVATPHKDYPKNKAILFLPDAFGPVLSNAQLLADDFARNGFKVFMPDYFGGDPFPIGYLTGEAVTLDIPKWISNHNAEFTRPFIDKLLVALKEQGITEFGATGYCFGGRYVFDLAFENIIKVAAVSHPSLLKRPEDLEKYAASSNAPLLINSCTTDEQFPHEAQAQADAILGNGKFAPGYKREHWEGCVHGFAIRGDLSDPKVKAGKEGSFKATVEWFAKL
ncbi:dienelactone hydrolase endo-1,3,1,4-beta-D-glucanase [Infundibulicybe gibba]|nr:dienelactone hydrolase endo-1,3,1,4-beta-D-glucanase [Infundibulicybe gibba]